MNRSVLHVDANCFYAAVEMQRRPEPRNKPVAVCGDQEARHGNRIDRELPCYAVRREDWYGDLMGSFT